MINNNDNLIERSCPNCGKLYMADPKRLKHQRQIACSRECSYAIRAKGLKKQTLFHCGTCGKEVWKAPSQSAKVKHGNVFCSSECHYAGRATGASKRIVTKPYNITPEGRAALLASYKNPNRKRKTGKIVTLTCLNCQKSFELLAWQRKNRTDYVFCSLDCCNAYRTGANNPAWRGGYPTYYGPAWRPLQKAARIRDDYTCRRCGKDMHKPHRAPDVHHIIPVSSFENRNDANTIDNVLCLCHLCHMHTEWHGIDFAL